MKSKLKQQNAITLVALIITIIVLLILAMVSIALVMNSGIITKSKTAVDKYSEEELQEQIKLAYSEWEIARWTGETRTAADFVKARLNQTYGENAVTDVTETNGVFSVVFADGREYTYNVASGTTEKVAKWNDNGDGTFTNDVTKSKIQIGDVVNYDELSNGVKSYTTDTTKGIGGSNTYNYDANGRYILNSKTYTTENFTWRVLGVNGNGQIELISENATSEDVCIANDTGYLYGREQLNKMCNDLYGKGMGSLEARSLKVEDLDELAGIKSDSDKRACWNVFGDKYKYRYPTIEQDNVNRNMQYDKDVGSGYSNSWTNISDNRYQRFRIPGTSIETEINSTNPGTSSEIVCTLYGYTISERITQIAKDGKSMSELISKGTTSNDLDQWLASNVIRPSENYVYFRVPNYWIWEYGMAINMLFIC